jgi:hypothetical protein
MSARRTAGTSDTGTPYHAATNPGQHAKQSGRDRAEMERERRARAGHGEQAQARSVKNEHRVLQAIHF